MIEPILVNVEGTIITSWPTLISNVLVAYIIKTHDSESQGRLYMMNK